MPRRSPVTTAQLTAVERLVLRGVTVLVAVLPPAGVLVLILGGSGLRVVGLVILFACVVLYAVPISPILTARVRRREARQAADDT